MNDVSWSKLLLQPQQSRRVAGPGHAQSGCRQLRLRAALAIP